MGTPSYDKEGVPRILPDEPVEDTQSLRKLVAQGYQIITF
jgi:hypothetical protein